MKQGLLVKLLGINIPVVTMVILILWLSLDTLAADYFSTLMKKYHIAPTATHQMFLLAVHRYLIWTSLGALLLGALLSFLLTRRVLMPLYEMIETARLISGGNYSSRVRSDSRDEIGELARTFNDMARSLERTEKLRRDMVADVAHELRTPLTNIRGYLEALQDGVVAPDAVTLDLLLDETLRLAHLVEDLLKLARADAAKTTLELEELDVCSLIRMVLRGFELACGEKSIRVRMNPQTGRCPLKADRQKLKQIVENLMENGVRYTPVGGEVTIRVEPYAEPGGQGRATRSVRVEVRNTGPGIAPEDLPFIFERFYRGEKSRSREFGGTGIGLAIVKELVEAHGGNVGVESSPGSTLFWFVLPGEDRPV